MVSPLHPDKAQLEPVGFPALPADPLDEFRSSLYPLFSLWFRLGHNRMLLNMISMGTNRNSLKVNATDACRSIYSFITTLNLLFSRIPPRIGRWYPCLKVVSFPFLQGVTRRPFGAVRRCKITETAFHLAGNLPCRCAAGHAPD